MRVEPPRPTAPPRPPAARVADERWLAQMLRRYHHRRLADGDPLSLLYPYRGRRDRELAALVASSLAYGHVRAMLPAIRAVLAVLGARPAETLPKLTRRALSRRLGGMRYRFTTSAQLTGLLLAMQRIVGECGSLEACFGRFASRSAPTALPAVAGFAESLNTASPCSLAHLVPDPARGSACKRLNLFLRWMIRRDGVDPGGWRVATPAQLVVPLDTHVHRTALGRGWTRRRSADLRTALEITAVLREICPADPLRYDFAITRPGIRRASAAGDPSR